MRTIKSYRIETIKPIAKVHKRVPGYWKRYHKSTGNDRVELEICRSICKELGLPWRRSSRGRKPKVDSTEYAAIQIYRRHKNQSYRDVEKTSVQSFGFFVDHSWVGKTLKRIPPLYFVKAVQLLHGRIKALLVKHGKSVHIIDSTGITSDRYTVSKKGKIYKLFVKLQSSLSTGLKLESWLFGLV